MGRRIFGSAAAEYAAARPGYPERVYAILHDRCGLGPSSRVLEIGAGTGQATARLAEFGAAIVAVEPNEALAKHLLAGQQTGPGFELVLAAFEDVDPPESSFDLVASATAFHWLDREAAFPKIASILRPGGWLALWWNVFGDPAVPDPFHDATEPILPPPLGPLGSRGGEFALDVAARLRDLSDHGFRDAEHEAVRWTLNLDAMTTRQLYATYSNIARLPAADREEILDEVERIAEVEFDGHVQRRIVTPIYTAHT
jgi:SAM-dependent methyltransferase